MVFTDIVGSTALLAEHGDAYGELLGEHRRQVRAIAAGHGGVEVDTQGDAFFLVFGRASDAISAARELVGIGGRVPVRVGVHTGEPARTGTLPPIPTSSRAAEIASEARPNTRKNASPWVSTSTPP